MGTRPFVVPQKASAAGMQALLFAKPGVIACRQELEQVYVGERPMSAA